MIKSIHAGNVAVLCSHNRKVSADQKKQLKRRFGDRIKFE